MMHQLSPSRDRIHQWLPVETLVEALRARTEIHGDETLYTFVEDGDNALSYIDVDRKARAVAADLVARGLIGERVILLHTPGEQYTVSFLGCLYAGAIAVPAFPPDPARLERTLPRLLSIIRDCDASALLTSAGLKKQLNVLARSIPQLKELEKLVWIASDAIEESAAAMWRDPNISGDTIAFLQYTSGSTRAPKGVMVSHHNIIENAKACAMGLRFGERDTSVTWLPPFHDMGLIGNLIQAVYSNIPTVVTSPQAFLQRPLGWLELISKHKATYSGAPNFAYNLCARRVTPEALETLDLSHWRIAFCGAEPVHPNTVRTFTAAFADAGFNPRAFVPCYGLAESTLIVSSYNRHSGAPVTIKSVKKSGLEQGWIVNAAEGDDDRGEIVSCGPTISMLDVRIVDPETSMEQFPGQVGEIWVAGGNVAQGYWGAEEETKRTFAAYLSNGKGPFLRTGDLGCIIDGELYIVGRQKDLIILAGRNLYPQDIEYTVERAHPAVRLGGVAAFAIEYDESENLVIILEVNPAKMTDADGGDIIDAVMREVNANHEISVHDVVLIAPRSLYKTSSGKVQRSACRQAYLNDSLEVVSRRQGSVVVLVPPVTETQHKLVEIFQDILETPSVGIQSSFYELGGDSLSAAEIAFQIQEKFKIELPFTALFDIATVEELATHVDSLCDARGSKKAKPELVASEDTGPTPTSFLQEEMWLSEQEIPGKPRDHAYFALRFRGAIDVAALEASLTDLTRRHETFRTTFPVIGEEPMQLVGPVVPAVLRRIDVSEDANPEASAREVGGEFAAEVFDMSTGPVWRGALIRIGDEDHLLALSMHHIVSDFWSVAVVTKELVAIYDARIHYRRPSLPKLPVQYRDYARWERSWMDSEEIAARLDFWREHLAQPLPVLDLPTDHPRPAAKSYRGAIAEYELAPALAEQTFALAKEFQVTPFMVMLGAYAILLGKRGKCDEVMIGTAVLNRPRAEVENMVGYFANMLPLRVRMQDDPSFREFLSRLKELLHGAYNHAELPPELLTREILGKECLPYRTAFLLQGAAPEPKTPAGLSVELDDIHNGSSNFDIEFNVYDAQGQQVITIEYDTDLFEKASIDSLWRDYCDILERVTTDSTTAVSVLKAENS